MKKFLVVSPHPDDSDFGAAGTIAKLVQEGNTVAYLIVSDGSKGSHVVGFGGEKLADIRQQEQQAAGKAVGVEQISFLGEVDGAVENTPELRKKLVETIRKSKPNIVLSFDPSSLAFDNMYRSHRDHRIVAETVFDAIYPGVGNSSFFPELAEQGLEPHQIEEIWFFATPRPNKWVDITGTIDAKLTALFSHKSQHQNAQEVEEIIRARAAKEGKDKGMRYAEAFRTVDFTRP